MSASGYGYHQDCLEKCCRICGLFKGEKRTDYRYDCSRSDIKEKIFLTFNVDINNDNPKIHPTKLCNNCYLCRKPIQPFTWSEHSEECNTCQYFQSKQRGGRKRKKFEGKGRPAKKNSVAENTKKEIEISPEILAPQIIETTPELARFLNLPPDVLCPICKEVLHRPLQSSCQHYFCLECIRTWLEHAGENSKCPVCSTVTSASTLEKAPRLLLNILRSLSVLCSKCKDPFPLEQLHDHETNCNNYIVERSTLTLPQLLQKPVNAPLDKNEEILATQLIKRKLASNKSHVFMKTGGSPLKLSVVTATRKSSSEAGKKTLQRRASAVESFREDIARTDDEDHLSVKVQQVTEVKRLGEDERRAIVKEAGLTLDIPPDEGLAMKTELGLPIFFHIFRFLVKPSHLNLQNRKKARKFGWQHVHKSPT